MNITINIPQFFNIDGKSGKNFNYLYPLSKGGNTDSRLFILSDGASGGNKGDASTLVTKSFEEYFTKKRPPKNNTVGQLYMNDALRYVEGKVRNYVQANPKERGIRSTVALLYFNDNDTITIAWVGNSRIYHVRGNQILSKTQDHTVNAYRNGEKIVVPRAISGIEPAYLSLSIVKDIRPGDYLMMCSEGVVETLDDRNIRYLLSQGDGSEGKNQAIANKIKDLCGAHSYKGCGMLLLQIDRTAEGSIADMPVKSTATAAGEGIDTGPIRKKGSGFKKPTISKSSRNAILMALLILTVVALAFMYKFQQSKPEVVFEQQMIEAEELMKEGQYEEAIALYQNSMALALEDTSVFGQVRNRIRQAEEQKMVGVADKLYKDGKLLKARNEYKNVLSVHPNSDYASKKLQSIEDYLLKEKMRLMVEADSLMQVKGFEEARNSLFEAMYLAQQDTQLLYLINNTYKALKEDTIGMELAVSKSVEIGTAPPPSPEEEEEALYTDVEEEEVEEEEKPKRRPTTKKPEKVVILKQDKDDAIITHQEYKDLLAAGKVAFEKGDLETASAKYKAALEYNKTEGVANKIKDIDKKIQSKTKYNDLMKQADAAFQSKKYEEAQRLYQNALEVKSDDGFAAQRIEIAKNMIEQANADKVYQKLISDADKAFNSNNFATARELYQKALGQTNDQTVLKAKIAKCNQKISAMQADTSKKRLRKGEKFCSGTNYNSECYYHLRDNNLLYSVNPQILYQLGKHFEGKDTNRSKECYNIAAGKGSAQAADRLKDMK